ncbi:F0F1 ATP synthase subunit B [Candidatus Parcubacteria bacterium]|nr:F0F1 ATP synthase subunit B [Candidatus Parcubacteria bacterium]
MQEAGILENLGIDWRILLGQIINFLVVLYVLKRFAYKPFLTVLNKRQTKIAEGIKNSEEAEKRIKMVNIQRDKVLNNAQKKAAQTLQENEERAKIKADQIISEGQKQKAEILSGAKQRGETEVKKMQEKQNEKIMDVSLSLVEKILKEKIDTKKDKEIISDFLVNSTVKNES